MTNTYIKMAALSAVFLTAAAQAQTVSTFEGILTTPGTYWNGDDSTHLGGFTDGNAFFKNGYNSEFMFWSEGFAVSNKKDTSTADTTSGFGQMYNAVSPGGAAASASYAIVQNGSFIKLTGAAAGKQPDGIYITNSNYTYLSMKWGDAFARQFNDSDFFILNIVGYLNGEVTDTSLGLYLADGTNLLNTWQWINLKPLGNVDSIGFHLESSDTGQFGMNTPAFFCIDNFSTTDIHTGINQVAAQLKGTAVYPNPTAEKVVIETAAENGTVTIFDITGQQYADYPLHRGANTLNIEMLQTGIYFLQLQSNGILETRKLVVQ
jgi:hypothetical protein